jgi:hypothetical protein
MFAWLHLWMRVKSYQISCRSSFSGFFFGFPVVSAFWSFQVSCRYSFPIVVAFQSFWVILILPCKKGYRIYRLGTGKTITFFTVCIPNILLKQKACWAGTLFIRALIRKLVSQKLLHPAVRVCLRPCGGFKERCNFHVF